MDDTLVTIVIVLLILLVVIRSLRRPAGSPGSSVPRFESTRRETEIRAQRQADARFVGPWGTAGHQAGRASPAADADMPESVVPAGQVLAEDGGAAMIGTRPQTPSEATTGQPFRFKTPDEITRATFGRVTEIPPSRGSGTSGPG